MVDSIPDGYLQLSDAPEQIYLAFHGECDKDHKAEKMYAICELLLSALRAEQSGKEALSAYVQVRERSLEVATIQKWQWRKDSFAVVRFYEGPLEAHGEDDIWREQDGRTLLVKKSEFGQWLNRQLVSESE